MKHAKEWFQDGELDLKQLKRMYTPFVKVPLDSKTKKPLDYPSRCKSNIYVNSKTGEFSFLLFNDKKEKVQLTKDNYTDIIKNRDELSTARQAK